MAKIGVYSMEYRGDVFPYVPIASGLARTRRVEPRRRPGVERFKVGWRTYAWPPYGASSAGRQPLYSGGRSGQVTAEQVNRVAQPPRVSQEPVRLREGRIAGFIR